MRIFSFIDGIIEEIIYYTYLKNKVKGRITILLECIIYFVFGIAGKGILFISDREKYLNLCTSYSKKLYLAMD
jgi:hypothetical protein